MTDNTPTPKPGPRPGPRPGGRPRRPAAPAGTPAVTPVVPRKTDPAKWGRVDDDGTVWVRTGDGERQVGSWQAGAPEEGLAHYGARYDDLATEIELLEARIQSHPEEAATVRASAEELKGQLPDAAVVGDLDALDRRLDIVLVHADEAGEKAKAEKAERRAAAIARKEKLAAEAEDIAENSQDWKAAGDRIRAILDEWKQIRGIDRKTDDQLWKRYSRARDAFNRRRGSHFAELDRNRASARKAKEALIEEAEALQHSTDWGPTAAAYRDLMARWKEAGRAPRDIDDKLWKRFKEAQDTFFGARNAAHAERDKEFEANAEAKDALLAEFDERIRPDKDLDHARSELRKLQERWDEIGFVPRGRVREFEDKIGALERRVADAADSQWRRTDPEAQARVQQFADRAAEFEAKAAEFEAAGKAKKAEEARAQAAQWREWADAAERALEEM
ncbi:DUF349 domain-containing protein [Corynebacterium freneyi]|uniref:DUF349 domain-containing protein n=1 Tax=Corynebacterium freneyi TaxID=134034 RepID=A0ABS4U7P7_9CORY|nr:DUF349 domain-containing protein [Corynebacterium freneyi]MBP2332688.1 hypothetical protein [Corynebacterium freneyi]QXA53160.1 DUF349 domain-containing protein [Corynebacterium freneyi]WJZ05207.1 hypothetical protein CFREN_06165 [Corynebacterium freneyi]